MISKHSLNQKGIFHNILSNIYHPLLILIKPMGKFGWPGPVADLVAFLSSERAGMITGASIVVDGGQSKSII